MLLQAFVPYSNASTTNETARYEDSHMVHTGQFFSTDLLNTYVSTAPCACLQFSLEQHFMPIWLPRSKHACQLKLQLLHLLPIITAPACPSAP